MFSFKILKKEGKARTGVISTTHGKIETPYLIPVATLGSVRALDSDDLHALGAQCSLANTYHLYLRPGEEVLKKFNGVRGFMHFDKPLFSDSGGFQAFSLGFGMEHNINKLGSIFPEGRRVLPTKKKMAKVTGKGVKFQSVYDGTWHFMDAKKSMQIQSVLGSDVIMAFDECTSPLSDKAYTSKALERTHRWAKDSLKYHDKKQALYGIVQGGWFRDLRVESAAFINNLGFKGIAIGGSLGKSKKDMHQILEWVIPLLDDRPRHLLGIGEIDDIFECVSRGIDTFDCVSVTRNARRGSVYISPRNGGRFKNKFRINIKSARFKGDTKPIDPGCSCMVCKNYSRAYLRHLYTVNELSYFRLASYHNVYFMLHLLDSIRKSIKEGTFKQMKKKWLM
ncbi:tRNA guanosine(34) transglycosylase Tgt [Candidatus Woesearchaeota archaeon]|nr:tRNA guanosine(34) transglycosylase Tgt [Candidatus Woesearchaeota archaeon]